MTTVRYGGGHTVTPRLRNWAARLQKGWKVKKQKSHLIGRGLYIIAGFLFCRPLPRISLPCLSPRGHENASVTRLLEQAAALFRAAELFWITGRGRDGRRFGLPIFAVIRVLAGLPTHARLGSFVEWPTRSNFNAILLGWGFTATAPNLPDTVPHDGFGLNQELDRAEG